MDDEPEEATPKDKYMTVLDAYCLKLELEKDIAALVREFEIATGTKVIDIELLYDETDIVEDTAVSALI